MSEIEEFVAIMKPLSSHIHIVTDKDRTMIYHVYGTLYTNINLETLSYSIPEYGISSFTAEYLIEDKYWYLTFKIGQFSVPIAYNENPLALISTIQEVYQMLEEHDSTGFLVTFIELEDMGFYIIFKKNNEFDIVLPPQTLEFDVFSYMHNTPPSPEWPKWAVSFRDNTWVVEFSGTEVARGTLENLQIFFRNIAKTTK